MSETCREPIPIEELVAYQAGDLEAAAEQRIEEHYFACDGCARRLEDLERLRIAIVEAARDGDVTTGATAELIATAVAGGAGVRSYRLEPGDVVPCTCGPEDAFVAIHLVAPIAADERVDIDVETRVAATGETYSHRREQVAVDQRGGEVIFLFAGDTIRELPRSRWTMLVRARGPGGERTLGPYTLEHTPWDELDGAP